MILHLGVVDVPYVARETAAQRRARVKKAAPKPAGAVSTGDVAEFLENKYHVMEVFFELHGDDIANDMAQSVAHAAEAIFNGAPVSLDPLGEATSEIDRRFRDFLSNREMDSLGYPGVPTKAAIKGVNHRLKARRGVERPSFIDTGLYQASFKSWVDDHD